MFAPSTYSGSYGATHEAAGKKPTAKQRAALAKAGKGDPAKLWATNPKTRPISWLGVASMTLGVPSDAILTIADGSRPGPGFEASEMRKSILGGLMALQSAGVGGVHTKGLHAPITGGKQADAALAKAAGMPGKSLETVYHHVVKRVSSYGPAMKALAWAHRAELWLADVAGIEKVHALSGAVVALFVPIGTAVGAAIGVHSSITMSLAKKIGARCDATIKASLPKAKAEVAKRQSGGELATSQDASATVAAGLPLPWILGIGAAVLGGVFLYRSR